MSEPARTARVCCHRQATGMLPPLRLPLIALLTMVLLSWMLPATASPGLAGPPGAPQQDPLPVMVRMTSLEPVVARPGAEVVLRGTVRNLGRTAVTIDSVLVRTADRGLDTPEAIEEWSLAGPDSGLGSGRVVGVDDHPLLVGPGAEVPFQVRIEAGRIDPPFDYATLPLQVQATAEAASSQRVLGSLATFLPWDRRERSAHEHPLSMSWLVPLTLPADPDLSSQDEDVRADAWRDATGPASPARTWLSSLAGSQATFAVDPALLEPFTLPPSLAVGPPGQDQPAEQDEDTPTGPTEGPDDAEVTGLPQPPPSDAPSDEVDGDGSATDPAAASSSPPQPTEPDDVDEPGPLEEAAGAGLRAALLGLPSEQRWWLPAHDPDVAALVQQEADTGLLRDLIAAEVPSIDAEPGSGSAQENESTTTATPPQVPNTAELVQDGRHDIDWPVATRAAPELVRALIQARSGTDEPLGGVVLPRSAVDTEQQPARAARPGTSGPVLLGYDETLSAALAAAASAEPPDQDAAGAGPTSALATQRVLAELMSRYQRAPANEQSVLVAVPRGTTPTPAALEHLVEALEEAGWLRQEPLAGQLERPGGDPVPVREAPAEPAAPGSSTTYPAPGPTPLTPTGIDRLQQVRTDLDAVGELLPNGGGVPAWHEGVLDLFAVRWRGQEQDWSAVLERAQALVREVQKGVSVRPSQVNFLADEGLIQVTVVNELPVTVSGLQLHVRPGNARLRIVDQPEPIEIGPQSRASVSFRAESVAAGSVPLTTWLSTPSGTPIGDRAELNVRVQPTGQWIYWVLGGLAGAILVLGLARALRPHTPQRRKDTDG